MLSKTDKPEIFERELSNKSGSAGTSTYVSLGSFVMPATGDIVTTFNSSYSYQWALKIFVNWNDKGGYAYYGNTNNITIRFTNINISKWDTVEFKILWNWGTTAVSSFNADVSILKMSINPLSMNAKEVKYIWGQVICFLYWIDSDGVYKGGIMLDKDTTATTGSITLGNAVGYIKVNFNGEIIKIPYYSN